MGGQAIDTSTTIGRMFLTMTAGFAEFERNQTSRTITAMQHKKQHLQAYSPTPFGFERSGPAHEKTGLPAELSRHSHQAEVVQMMKRWDAERWTYQPIADELMKRCVPTSAAESAGMPRPFAGSFGTTFTSKKSRPFPERGNLRSVWNPRMVKKLGTGFESRPEKMQAG